MKKLLLSMLVCLVVILDGDVAMSNTLPDWGYVCVTSDIRSGPEMFYPVVGSVEIGERVRIHDQSRPDGNWVSIGVVQWIPLKNICEWNE